MARTSFDMTQRGKHSLISSKSLYSRSNLYKLTRGITCNLLVSLTLLKKLLMREGKNPALLKTTPGCAFRFWSESSTCNRNLSTQGSKHFSGKSYRIRPHIPSKNRPFSSLLPISLFPKDTKKIQDCWDFYKKIWQVFHICLDCKI